METAEIQQRSRFSVKEYEGKRKKNEDCVIEYIINIIYTSNIRAALAKWEEAKGDRKTGLKPEIFCPDCGKDLGRWSKGRNLHGDS